MTPFVLLALAFATLIVGGVTAAGVYDRIEAWLARREARRPVPPAIAVEARASVGTARRPAPAAARPTTRPIARAASASTTAARRRRAPRARPGAAASSAGSGGTQVPLFPTTELAPGRSTANARSARSSGRQVAPPGGPGRARIVVRRLGTPVAGGR